jgi:arabinofuranosyltransferase
MGDVASPLMALGLSWYAALLTLALFATTCLICGLVFLSRRRALISISVVAVLGFSRAFVDYSTSGLENPLTACLVLALLVAVPPGAASVRDVRRSSVVLALLALTRLDAILLGLPACVYVAVRAVREGAGASAVARAFALGMLPLLSWEAFAVIYYGFPFPNTAYAKLNTGIDTVASLRMGADYFAYTLARDPWTLVAPIVLAIGAIISRTGSSGLALGAGAFAYYAYVMWIGGDFMGGRFFVAPLVLLTGLLVSRHVAVPRRAAGFLLSGVLIVGAACWLLPAWRAAPVQARGTLDERATYAKDTGLLHVLRGTGRVEHGWLRRGEQWRYEAAAQDRGSASGARSYRHAYAVGMLGLAAGPGVHIIDHLALTDAFLARLPAAYDPVIQVGHFERMGQWSSKKPILTECPLDYQVCRFWRDYEITLRTGVCALDDRNLCEYWAALRNVTEGAIFSRSRWLAIVRFNLGLFDPLIDRRRYREASLEYPGERPSNAVH